MESPIYFSIAKLHELLSRRELSSVELTKLYLAEIEKKKDLNAYLFMDHDGALASAEEADQALASSAVSNGASPLTGIPLAVKDNILLMHKPCTAGSNILKNYIASYDATVITKLKKAGAVFLGKTNMDEFAMGSSTEHSAFGPVKNAIDRRYVPGGSSGGSATAVAGFLAAGALGSDTGGSIRQPAAFSGIVGFKPSYGAVSRYGLMAMASSFDQIGPMARTVADAETIFEAIVGRDRNDATSKDVDEAEAVPIRSLRIGVPKEYFAEGLDARIKKAVEAAINKYASAGASVSEVSLPHTALALPTYYIIMPSEVSANLARYDGFRYGYSHLRESDISMEEAYKKARSDGFGKEARRRIMLGTYTLSAGYYDAYYKHALKVRTRIVDDFTKVFKAVDVLMAPTTPTLPFKLGEKKEDPVAMYLSDVLTVAVNLAGLPAISLPCGTIEEGEVKFSAGLQIIGPFGQDRKVLKTALLRGQNF